MCCVCVHFSVKRNHTTDYPVLAFIEFVGNDVCNTYVGSCCYRKKVFLHQELMPLLWGRCSLKKSLRLHRFTSDRDEIWHDCSSDKYVSID